MIQFFDGKNNIGLGRIWSFVLAFRSLVARLAPFERVGTKRAKKFLATESVSPLRISAPQRWPLSDGRDGKCEGREEKVRVFGKGKWKLIANCANFWQRECVNSSPILARQWWRHFRLSLYLSLSLSLSPNVPHAQYRKRFRASYNKSCEGYCQTLLFEEFTLALFDPSSNTRVLSGVEVRSQSWWSCKNRSAAAIMLCFRLWKNDLTTIRSSYFTRLSQIWPPPIWLSCCHHHRTTLDIPLEKNCTLSLLLKNRPPSLVFCHARLFFGIAYRQNCRRAPLLARLSQL